MFHGKVGANAHSPQKLFKDGGTNTRRVPNTF